MAVQKEVKHMQMTNSEIVMEFTQAKNRRKQVTILADQNLCTEAEIADILREEIKDGRLTKCLKDIGEDKSEADSAETVKGDSIEDSISAISARIRELKQIRAEADGELKTIYRKIAEITEGE